MQSENIALKQLINSQSIRKNFETFVDKYKGKKVLLYGAGKFFDVLYKEYDFSKLCLAGIADKKFKRGCEKYLNGLKCYSPSEVYDLNIDVILITTVDSGVVKNYLKKYYNDIDIKTEELVDRVSFLLYFVQQNYQINLICPDSAYEVIPEIFMYKSYELEKYIKLKEHIVIDAGMNRGYASLYFAQNPLCKQVYGFEPCKRPYKIALEQFNLNNALKNKITPLNYGLSDKDEETNIYYYADCDYDSTILDSLKTEREICETHTVEEETVLLKNSETEMRKIFSQNENCDLDYVLKIDIEGAEFKVIPQLYSSGVLSKFKVIIGELHKIDNDNDAKNLMSMFFNAGFLPVFVEDRPGTILFLFTKSNLPYKY